MAALCKGLSRINFPTYAGDGWDARQTAIAAISFESCGASVLKALWPPLYRLSPHNYLEVSQTSKVLNIGPTILRYPVKVLHLNARVLEYFCVKHQNLVLHMQAPTIRPATYGTSHLPCTSEKPRLGGLGSPVKA